MNTQIEPLLDSAQRREDAKKNRFWFHSQERLNALHAAVETWIGTPFCAHGMVPGPKGGASCQTLVGCVLIDAGCLPSNFVIPAAPLDWGRSHRESLMERFLDACPHVASVPGDEYPPVIGDVLLFQCMGTTHHLGIVAEPNRFLSTLSHDGAQLRNLNGAAWLKRLRRVWRPVEI